MIKRRSNGKIQKRYEAQKFVVYQLHKIPHKVVRKENITADRIRQLLRGKLEFEELRQWLKNKKNRLQLTKFDIGGKMDLLILYFILELEDDERKQVFKNCKILDEEAQEVCRELLKYCGTTDIQDISLENFVALFYNKKR